MGGGGGGGGSPGSFEIGTFFVPTPQNGYGSSGNQDGSGGREAGPPQRGIYHPQPNPAAASGGGPGIRETGIIEKLLVSLHDSWVWRTKITRLSVITNCFIGTRAPEVLLAALIFGLQAVSEPKLLL